MTRIISWNIKALPKIFDKTYDRNKVARYLVSWAADIVALQEDYRQDILLSDQHVAHGRHRWWAGKVLNSGLTIYSKHKFQVVENIGFSSCAGQDCLKDKGVLAVEFERFFLVNTHMCPRKSSLAPAFWYNWAKKNQLKELIKIVKKLDKKPVIVTGDFNFEPDSPIFGRYLRENLAFDPIIYDDDDPTHMLVCNGNNLSFKARRDYNHISDHPAIIADIAA